MIRRCLLTLVLVIGSRIAIGDGPADNDPRSVRRVPTLGIEVPAKQREELEHRLAELGQSIAALRKRAEPRIQELLPDVEIHHRAVDDALKYQEFFQPRDVTAAFELLDEGQQRADHLVAGRAPWTTASGLVVRGFSSKLDGSVQPYGLVIPESYSPTGAHPHRLDLWFHGRGETLSEVEFLQQRRTQVGQFAPPDAIVLHPYGRYSNAFKFAGEVDVLEALESVRKRYRIDEDRIAVRGFSMGGAACWQFAVHYADRWFAANPGAGFAETPEFLKSFQKETLDPTWFERKLWHLYDCTDWAINLYHCPTVAYSGELDSQKQAADIMQAALEREGIDLVHVIGPQTKHSYHPEAKVTVERLLGSLAEKGRDRVPPRVRFTTYTLKYNRMAWVEVEGLAEHWKRARVEAEIMSGSEVSIRTENVTDLRLLMPAGWAPFDLTEAVTIQIDGNSLEGPRPKSDRSWETRLHTRAAGWRVGTRSGTGLRKRHGLQGPIDDAFLDSFLFVRPTESSASEMVGQWVEAELERAIEHWRRHFRGHARVKRDLDVTPEDLTSSNLILWGDPASNAVIREIADRLPIRWEDDQIRVGEHRFPASHHAVIMIYPNPLNPDRYVVLNSGFTYRDYAYLNNARQVPELPDWAIVDLRTPPDTLWPGKVVAADFFGERWELRPARSGPE